MACESPLRQLLGVYRRQFGVIQAMIDAGTFTSDKAAKVRVSTSRAHGGHQ